MTPRITRNKKKIFYTLEWGKKPGQRIATGIFSYVSPEDSIQQHHNQEALRILEIKKAQMILDYQAVGTGSLPSYRYQVNFLDYYKDYISENRQAGNRHLQGSYKYFKQFLKKTYLSPIDITPDLSLRFRKYLLDHLNGETPANYFARFKTAVRAATHAGYFKINPTSDITVKANKNKRRKENLEAEEYLQLLKAPSLNEEIRDAFLFCCYTGLRWCDTKSLTWQQVRGDDSLMTIVQQKTAIEHQITLHPVAKVILEKRRVIAHNQPGYSKIFRLPTADGANKILSNWCEQAGLKKHITWSCARLSFSILLQDANVDTATVSLLLGHHSAKYIHEVYKRYRPKDQDEVIRKLPDPFSKWGKLR